MTFLESFFYNLLKKTGVSMIANWRLDHLELASHLKRVLARKEIDCIFDVGANHGQYYNFLRNEAGFKGHVFSFEPIQHLAIQLRERAASDPLWHIYQVALGANVGEAVINIMTHDDFSSFLKPDNTLTPEFSSVNRIEQIETVSIRCIDDVIPEIREIFNFKNLYLKIDTQGFDLEVIKGAKDSLKNIAAIQCEVSVIPIYQGAPDFNTTITTLKALGFDLSGLFPVTHDENLRAIEFDCIAINSSST